MIAYVSELPAGYEGLAVKVLLRPSLGRCRIRVRVEAVYALAEIGDRRAVTHLIRVLDGEDENVWLAADFHLREAFSIRVDPETEQIEIIV